MFVVPLWAWSILAFSMPCGNTMYVFLSLFFNIERMTDDVGDVVASMAVRAVCALTTAAVNACYQPAGQPLCFIPNLPLYPIALFPACLAGGGR